MTEAGGPRVLVVSPPFLSHAKPLAVVGGALARRGCRVTFACVPELRHLADDNGLGFVSFTGTANRNTHLVSTIDRPDDHSERLAHFLRATRRGAVAALTAQARNRRDDMLHDPGRVLADLRAVCAEVRPDWCLVDQLNYPVTLALHCLGTPFASFVAGHPTDLPRDPGSLFGVPLEWPPGIVVDQPKLGRLVDLARDVDRAFTEFFNATIRSIDTTAEPISSAFSFSSDRVRVFNYPDVESAYPRRAGDLFIGHCGDPRPELPDEWRHRLAAAGGRAWVLISLGTFQWVHTDVIRTVHQGVRQARPDAITVIVCGDRTADMRDIADDRTLIADFVPQQALLPHLDLVVHHGGNNSFTESLVAAKPAVVLPFAADQFAVAADVARLGVGRVLDPNHCTSTDVADAVRIVLREDTQARVGKMAAAVSRLGPDWAAGRMIELMEHARARPATSRRAPR